MDSYSGATLTKLVATALSGVLIGLTAAALQLAVDVASRQRNAALDALLAAHGALPATAALLGMSAGVVLATTVVVHALAPRAAGGGVALVRWLAGLWPARPAGLWGLPLQGRLQGRRAASRQAWDRQTGARAHIRLVLFLLTRARRWCTAPATSAPLPQVMALLNGNSIPGLLTGAVFAVKLLGTAASRLAGLALGIEGPMVHLGACVASLVCHAEHGAPQGTAASCPQQCWLSSCCLARACLPAAKPQAALHAVTLGAC